MSTEAAANRYRPVSKDTGVIAPRLRRIIGVREDILDFVPEERPRYTRLGAIVCATSTLSALSMMVVTGRLLPGGWWVVGGAVAVFWGALILILDSWLISSLHGVRRSKALVYLPRLLIAVLLGCVIAEPLVVLVFRPAVAQQVTDDRATELARVLSEWRVCNPVPAPAVSPPGCRDHRLTLRNAVDPVRAKQTSLTAQRDQLAPVLAADYAQWNVLEGTAQAECKGIPGAQTTGVPGEGPECTRNRETADRFLVDKQLDRRQQELNQINNDLVALNDQVATVESSYGEEVEAAITAKSDEWLDSRRTVGILEELDALGKLSDKSVPVNFAHWVLRLLLVLFDCMPVLAKWMAGATAYDRAVTKQVETCTRLHEKNLERREAIDDVYGDEHRAKAVHRPQATLAGLADEADREERDRARMLEEEVERRFETIRRDLS